MESRQKNISRWRRWGKRLGIALAVFVGFLFLIQILFSLFAESYLKAQMVSAVEKARPRVKAKIANLSLFTLKRQIKIEHIRIWQYPPGPDSTRRSLSSDSLSIQSITVRGIHLYRFFIDHALILKRIRINKANLFTHKHQNLLKGKIGNQSVNAFFYQQIHPFCDVLKIRNFDIHDLSVSLGDVPYRDPTIATVQNLSIHFSGVNLDSSWAQNQSPLPSEIYRGSIGGIQWINSQFYHFKTGRIRFSSYDNSVSVNSIALEPQIPKYEFSKTAGHEIDRLSLNIKNMLVQNINLDALINSNKFAARSITLKTGRLDIFHSKIPPAGPTTKHVFPQLLFQKMKYPVSVDSVILSDADISYSEQENLVPDPGIVTFKHTNATIINLNNRAVSNSASGPIIMQVSSNIMGSGHLEARFTFPNNKSGSHHISGSIGTMPMRKLNSATENMGSVKIERGQIHSINFDMELGPTESTGTLNMNYSDLKIKILTFDETKNQDSKQFKSLLANTFVVKKNNRPPLRTGTISFERLPEKSIFNYWWKSLLSGLKSSIGF
ncbi:MAG TPA: hypothetical protein VJ964_08555 [Balneolaceae bacterium]|nr:hypothetical protein [Balneolaceae bacterium]